MSKTVLQRAAGMREFALSFPEAHEEFPWGDRVIKVKGKIFAFLGSAEGSPEQLSMSVKLPFSGSEVLGLPQAAPTGYGLGKAGWVTLRFPPSEVPPLELLCHWIEESYRAVAPKSVIKQMDAANMETISPAPAERSPKDGSRQSARSRAAAPTTTAAKSPKKTAKKVANTGARKAAGKVAKNVVKKAGKTGKATATSATRSTAKKKGPSPKVRRGLAAR